MLIEVMKRYKQEREMKVLIAFFAVILFSSGSIRVFQQHSNAGNDRIHLEKNSADNKMIAMA